MKNGARVYSYLRFSDPRQATGSSADRQAAYAAAWAAERGLVLDDSLSLRDEGLSAYHQQHVRQGALGAFLRAVDAGQVAPGSVLIVEGFDRLSRADALTAQAQLAQIINAGLTVVTASDGREYSRESLAAQPMDLVYSLLVMIRAHEESDTKSKRVRASIRRLCEQWRAGTYRGLIRNGKDPAWLRWTGDAWELIPERVAAVRRALELYQQGYGAAKASAQMHAEGHALTELGMAGQQIYRLVKLPALIGVKRLTVDGEDFELGDYYPRLLTDAEWDALQMQVGQRTHRRGGSEIPGIITGVGLTWCGYCGGALVSQNLYNRRRADGTLSDGHRRLFCCNYAKGGGCPGGSCSVMPIERAIMAFCSDQLNLDRLQGGADPAAGLRERLAAARAAADDAAQQVERLTDMMLAASAEGVPLAWARRARELEQQQADQQALVAQLQRELAAVAGGPTVAQAEQWQALAAGVAADDYGARVQVRQLMLDTFARVQVWANGLVARRGGDIDILLTPKNGAPRMLRIDRRSGAFVVGADGIV